MCLSHRPQVAVRQGGNAMKRKKVVQNSFGYILIDHFKQDDSLFYANVSHQKRHLMHKDFVLTSAHNLTDINTNCFWHQSGLDTFIQSSVATNSKANDKI